MNEKAAAVKAFKASALNVKPVRITYFKAVKVKIVIFSGEKVTKFNNIVTNIETD